LPVDVKLFDSLDAVEADAGDMLSREARPSIFDRLSWFALIAEHCPPPGRLLVARARDGESDSWLFLSVSGDKAQSLTAWYSLRFALVGDPQGGEAIARALRSRLARVALAPLAEPASLAGAFRKAGWIVFVEPATASWQCPTEGMDFDSYWARRPSKLRNTAARKAKAAGLDIRIHHAFDAEAWADYESIYAASWKGEEGAPAFLRALAEEEGRAGTLRLGIASKDGKAIAAQLWLVENGKATIHKLAYAEAAKSLSPGTILGVEMFRAALDQDRVSRIDYGTGGDAYKADWMEEQAALWRIRAFNPRRPSGLAGAARAAASALVARLRRH
jgi:hypothetical protein